MKNRLLCLILLVKSVPLAGRWYYHFLVYKRQLRPELTEGYMPCLSFSLFEEIWNNWHDRLSQKSIELKWNWIFLHRNFTSHVYCMLNICIEHYGYKITPQYFHYPNRAKILHVCLQLTTMYNWVVNFLVYHTNSQDPDCHNFWQKNPIIAE